LRTTSAPLAFNCQDYDPNSEWYRCRSLISQSQEACHKDYWVVSSSPFPGEETVTGRIIEILQTVDSTAAIVILEQFVMQNQRHEVYNLTFTKPRRREEAVFFILKPEVR
jgi:hypothetical protein